jgi:hypothetical protein
MTAGSPRIAIRSQAAELADRLAQQAEAVCRHYLFNGCRTGQYWHVGDVANTPGHSLYVRLAGTRAGKWVDAATGDHGDLLDLIARNQSLPALRDTLDEARRFLALPCEQPHPRPVPAQRCPVAAARRLFASARPIAGTIAADYLRQRHVGAVRGVEVLRFHPRCFYRAHETARPEARPALIAAVTDLENRMTGVQRTWLDPSGRTKAPISDPRRALGHLQGNGVRFGTAADVLVAGEGIETVLSLRLIMPALAMVAALSASHLGALLLPAGLKRLYVACDADAAGRHAFDRLAKRGQAEGIDVHPLYPMRDDFNDDLCALGPSVLCATIRDQIVPEDLTALAAHASA